MYSKLLSAAALLLFGSHLALAQNSPDPSNPALAPVHLEGNYFTHDGHPFIPVGVNWVPARTGMEWPTHWDPQAIEADFRHMHELGLNTVRLDLVWGWFEPRPDDFNPEAFRQLDFLVQLAHRYQIYLHPELLIGGEVGEAWWDVSYRHGRDPQSDPYMLRLETDFAAELAKRYGKESAIFAWDLTDEPPFWISSSVTDPVAVNWTRLIAGALRKHDSQHTIVVGTSMEDIGRGAFRPDQLAPEVDFFSIHPYTIYANKLFPDAMLSERQTYGAAFESLLSRGAGHPVLIQELGASSAQYSPEAVARYERATLYSSFGVGVNGFLLWCYTDAAPNQIAKVPYLRSPHETQFGIVDWQGHDRPAATMLRSFASEVNQLDLAEIAPAPAEAALLVPYEWSKSYGDASHYGLSGPEVVPYVSTFEGGNVNGQAPATHGEENNRLMGAWLSSYILARRAGLQVAMPREQAGWQAHPLLLLPSPLTSTSSPLVHVHSDFWQKASSYVEQGGTLYASLSGDAAIPEMAPLFGARLVDHLPVREVTLKFVAPFGNIKAGESFTFAAAAEDTTQWASTLEVSDGSVMAVDQDGRPALIAHALGKGKTLLSAYPIELYLAAQPSAFEGKDETHRLYQALVEWAGIKRAIWTDNKSVEASALNAASHGLIVLTNHSATSHKVHLASTLPIHGLTLAEGGKRLAQTAQGWELEIPAYDGLILNWK